MIWLSVKRDFFIEISRFRLRENSTYEHTGFSGGLPKNGRFKVKIAKKSTIYSSAFSLFL